MHFPHFLLLKKRIEEITELDEKTARLNREINAILEEQRQEEPPPKNDALYDHLERESSMTVATHNLLVRQLDEFVLHLVDAKIVTRIALNRQEENPPIRQPVKDGPRDEGKPADPAPPIDDTIPKAYRTMTSKLGL